jgi:drug/metabolite transporter (DMT)-like permease
VSEIKSEIKTPKIRRVPAPLALSLKTYQAIWVVGLTYLLWYGLVQTFSASKLSAFTFITPFVWRGGWLFHHA